jgi:ABC-type dipeptide/oligopeptide/nickel transport system permease subunit
LLRQAFPDPLSYYHLMLIPGAAIFLTVCAFNLAGEGLRKALSGKERV